jgi:hypothetical protein
MPCGPTVGGCDWSGLFFVQCSVAISCHARDWQHSDEPSVEPCLTVFDELGLCDFPIRRMYNIYITLLNMRIRMQFSPNAHAHAVYDPHHNNKAKLHRAPQKC